MADTLKLLDKRQRQAGQGTEARDEMDSLDRWLFSHQNWVISAHAEVLCQPPCGQRTEPQRGPYPWAQPPGWVWQIWAKDSCWPCGLAAGLRTRWEEVWAQRALSMQPPKAKLPSHCLLQSSHNLAANSCLPQNKDGGKIKPHCLPDPE